MVIAAFEMRLGWKGDSWCPMVSRARLVPASRAEHGRAPEARASEMWKTHQLGGRQTRVHEGLGGDP